MADPLMAARNQSGHVPRQAGIREFTEVGPFGLGCAALGNLGTAISDEAAAELLEAAWVKGVRWFDTAPHYGLGLSERRLGEFLRDKPRNEFVVSTKVGRLLVPNPGGGRGRDPEGFDVPATHRRQWDFSRAGVLASLDASRERLGLDSIDIVLIHDPLEHREWARSEAYVELDSLRAAGEIGSVGVGTRDTAVLQYFVERTDLDLIMLAGRFTLLDQSAATELFPACLRRGTRVLNAGVFNSGVLATNAPAASSTFEYATAPEEIVLRARQIAAVCNEFGVTLPEAALAFARRHPAIDAVVVGAASADQLNSNAELANSVPPERLWSTLAQRFLVSTAW